MNYKNSYRILKIAAAFAATLLIYMVCGCNDKGTSTTAPEFAYEGVWEDEFNGISIDFNIFVDTAGPPIYKAENDISIITPMKSVLTIEPDFFDVRIYANDTELVNNFAGDFICSSDTLIFAADDIGTFVFGNKLFGNDSLYIYDFMYSDTTQPICYSSLQRFLLWDCGSYSMIQESRGVFYRVGD